MSGQINLLHHGDGLAGIVCKDSETVFVNQQFAFWLYVRLGLHALGQQGQVFLHLCHGVGAVGRHGEVSHHLWLLLRLCLVETRAANGLLVQLGALALGLRAELHAVVGEECGRASNFLGFLYYHISVCLCTLCCCCLHIPLHWRQVERHERLKESSSNPKAGASKRT